MLPQCQLNYNAVHRRFQRLYRSEVLKEVMADLAGTLRDETSLDESECFIDTPFASVNCGGEEKGVLRETV